MQTWSPTGWHSLAPLLSGCIEILHGRSKAMGRREKLMKLIIHIMECAVRNAGHTGTASAAKI